MLGRGQTANSPKTIDDLVAYSHPRGHDFSVSLAKSDQETASYTILLACQMALPGKLKLPA